MEWKILYKNIAELKNQEPADIPHRVLFVDEVLQGQTRMFSLIVQSRRVACKPTKQRNVCAKHIIVSRKRLSELQAKGSMGKREHVGCLTASVLIYIKETYCIIRSRELEGLRCQICFGISIRLSYHSRLNAEIC
ncbi:hypothetical protein NPIL_654191 [Nephila pilipes]|uniref:Uncharacterized protein n=1 Tax=Nephila pilipes TaxID=299642 RepID=A0A8X6THK7_NEPPI|nr:hypothetical protein NPIL_654191 [Nephila pilipes]